MEGDLRCRYVNNLFRNSTLYSVVANRLDVLMIGFW